MKRYSYIILLISIPVFGQIGINTQTPQAIFHVDAQGDTPSVAATNSQVSDDFVVQETTGNVGIGNLSPKVKLDIRQQNTNSALGLGNTTMTAEEAGKGAMRYNNGKLQYSNGLHWSDIETEIQEKTVVIATKLSSKTYAYEQGGHSCSNCEVPSGAPHRTSAYLIDWTQKYSNSTAGGSFDASTGVFTANRPGTFTATFTFTLAAGSIWAWEGSANPLDNNQIEAIWRIYNASGQEINSIKCANNFPSDSRNGMNTSGDAKAGSNCTGSIYLEAGQSFRPALWIDLDSNRGRQKPFDLTSIGSGANQSSVYNNLTIVEN